MIGGWGRRYAYSLGLVCLAAACGGGGDGPGIVNAPVVIAVTVQQPATNPIDIGGTAQLTANVEVQNGASQSVEWSSSAPNVATVSQSGLVTGVAGGQATITATAVANRTKTGSASITVNPPRVVSVALNTGPRTIRVGENFAVVATVETRGTIARTVNFSSSAPNVATVSSADGLTGTIVGVGAGTTTITATSTADATKNTTFTVTVSGTVRITSVTPSPVNIRAGTTVKLTPTVQADPGVSAAVTYQSQNTGIATVAADGTVTGVAVGQTSVVVRSVADNTVSLSVPVTIRSGVTSVSLTPDRDSLRRGSVRQLTLSVVTEAGVSNAVQLTSASSAIATIDQSGRVTAVANGQTYVRAISTVDQTVGDSTLITVVDPCSFFIPLVFGTPNNGVVNDLSCTATAELFWFSFNQQTTLLMSGTPQFAAAFTVLGDKSGSWFTNVNAAQTASLYVIGTANKFFARMAAQTLAARGSFAITATVNPTITNACTIVATTGITVNVPLSACGFVPQNRPAGTYNSVNFAILPVMAPGDRLTMTVTAPAGIFPLVEVRFGTNAPVQAIATGTTLVQQFTAPAVAGYTQVTVTTRDATQTGTVSVKIEGPPTISFDAFALGSGVLGSRAQAALPPHSLP